METNDNTTVLITGATGYIGGRLVRALVPSDYEIRCMVRNPDYVRGRIPQQVSIVQGDVFDTGSLDTALQGVDTAYYNVHSLGGRKDFEEQDRIAAQNFADAAKRAGVSKIIYLGGLGRGPNLSKHLASRQEVGKTLASTGIPTIELRASIVIGSGSLSFEMARSLVEKLPVMTTPKWVRSKAQPIAIEDVIAYLVESLRYQPTGHEIFEIGGSDIVSYEEIMRIYAEIRGLKRLILPVPVLTPGLSSKWLGLVTPLYARVGRWLIDGVKNDTVVTDNRAKEVFGVSAMGIREAIERALENEDRETAETRWSDSLGPYYTDTSTANERRGSRYIYSRSIFIPVPREQAFLPIQYIGGHNGWYSHGWMWTLRGFIDKVLGGVGKNRGRRDPLILLPGDAVDFWRVEDIDQYLMLRLKSEMKLPGRGWLQFETNTVDTPEEGTEVSVHAIFEPKGLRGIVYWYMLYPFHLTIFKRMLEEIRHASYHGT